MSRFDQLAEKGELLVAQRDAATDAATKAQLDKEIKSVRAAQISELAKEIADQIRPQIPAMIAEAIKQSGIMDKVGKLQGNAEQLARHVQQGVPTVGEYFDADPAFMREVEEHLGSYLTAQQKNYFDGDSIAAGVDLHDYFDGPDEAAGVDLSAYFVRKDS
ncbi:hypothetical protein ACSFM0_001280 [Escherichia coli]|nr:hypothetical protein [Escherichia coli]EFF9100763.1 hypothetical protein [Escherichia coli]EHK6137194.1 hypothetical protein [Escherichia coli]EHW6699253.1 hypothetical protein [Escherichia coli]EIN0392067.1 hypothetical protein [Escherichia coli]